MIRKVLNFVDQIFSNPPLLQQIGLALLTLLVPLGTGLVIEMLGNRGLSEFKELDLRVVLDKVFRLKKLVIVVLIVFLIPLFIKLLPIPSKMSLMVAYSAAIIALIAILIDFYYWVKGDRWKFRYAFLRHAGKEDLEKGWNIIWTATIKEYQRERELFEIFNSQIKRSLGVNKRKPLIKDLRHSYIMIVNFKSTLKKRSSTFLVDLVPSILRLHYKIWQKEKHYRANDGDTNLWFEYDKVLVVLNEILEGIFKIFLDQRISIYLLLKEIDDFCKALSVSGNKEYLSDLFGIFIPIIFDNAEMIKWQHFPQHWLITKDSILNKANPIPNVIFEIFLEWCHERIIQTQLDFDAKLEKVLHELFPTLDPSLWSEFLLLAFSQGDPSSRIQTVLERRKSFGLMGRTFFSGETSIANTENTYYKIREMQRKAVIEFIYIFPEWQKEFSSENLKMYKKELERLKYEGDSSKESRRIHLLELVNMMMEYVSQINGLS